MNIPNPSAGAADPAPTLNFSEKPVCFSSADAGANLYGILHLPRGAREYRDFLLMLVGGPQNRVGSHRSYVTFARTFAAQGIPVMRFEYEGMGDSEGEWRGYAYAGPSLKAAIDFLQAEFPSLRNVVLWSLCDGSAACALYSPSDVRIGGMILSNPFVHSPQGQARTFLKYYYLRRLANPEFWKKLASGRFNPFTSAKSMRDVAKAAAGDAPAKPIAGMMIGPGDDPPDLPKKVMAALNGFRGPLRLVLSTADLTAQEFLALYRDGIKPRGRSKGGSRSEEEIRFIEGADHTFTRQAWKDQVAALTVETWKSMRGYEA